MMKNAVSDNLLYPVWFSCCKPVVVVKVSLAVLAEHFNSFTFLLPASRESKLFWGRWGPLVPG